MKIISINKIATIALVCFGVSGLISLNSCVEGKKSAAKSGMQLWSENCGRCHNSPSSNNFSQEEWRTVGLHMQSRALLTNKETDKIIEFLSN